MLIDRREGSLRMGGLAPVLFSCNRRASIASLPLTGIEARLRRISCITSRCCGPARVAAIHCSTPRPASRVALAGHRALSVMQRMRNLVRIFGVLLVLASLPFLATSAALLNQQADLVRVTWGIFDPEVNGSARKFGVGYYGMWSGRVRTGSWAASCWHASRDEVLHNQPLLWTGPRRGCTLSYSSAQHARRVAGHRAAVLGVKGFIGSDSLSTDSIPSPRGAWRSVGSRVCACTRRGRLCSSCRRL